MNCDLVSHDRRQQGSEYAMALAQAGAGARIELLQFKPDRIARTYRETLLVTSRKLIEPGQTVRLRRPLA